MNNDTLYDVAIIGGGLAGLSLAILLARQQHRVVVLEKSTYPKHKVCGEYVSMESWSFLEGLGLPLSGMKLPVMSRLHLTDARGNEIDTRLPQSGFGISRYLLDDSLADLARQAGAELLTKTPADDVLPAGDHLTVRTGDKIVRAKVVCGSWGKRSNLDVKMQRSFIQAGSKALNNYIGIKYHIRYGWKPGYIGLHNFANGYCGISHIEDDKCCLCYLTTAANLQKNANDIRAMEQQVLMKNPWLHKICSEAEFLYQSPLAISQISFQQKELVRDHVLLLGDAAGMITPLCGNGMSMALHSAKLAGKAVQQYLQGNTTRQQMEQAYTTSWTKQFSRRLSYGRFIQRNFGKERTTALFIKTMKALPILHKPIIKATAGNPF